MIQTQSKPVDREHFLDSSFPKTEDERVDSSSEHIRATAAIRSPVDSVSDTEPETDDASLQTVPVPQKSRSSAIPEAKPPSGQNAKAATSHDAESQIFKGRMPQCRNLPPSSNVEASPPPQKKKRSSPSDSDDDSDIGGGADSAHVRRGARQPVKRGGRRF
jgi:hypothetical protein